MPWKSSLDISKVDIFGWNFENFENFRKNDNFIEGGDPALRGIRAGTRLTVHRSFPLGQSGAAHAGARDHENIVLDKNMIDKSSWESNNWFRYCIEDLDRANKT